MSKSTLLQQLITITTHEALCLSDIGTIICQEQMDANAPPPRTTRVEHKTQSKKHLHEGKLTQIDRSNK